MSHSVRTGHPGFLSDAGGVLENRGTHHQVLLGHALEGKRVGWNIFAWDQSRSRACVK